MYKRLIFIHTVKKGKKVSEVCDILGITESTGHRWLDNYNEKGLHTNHHNSG
jgi:putative transposase